MSREYVEKRLREIAEAQARSSRRSPRTPPASAASSKKSQVVPKPLTAQGPARASFNSSAPTAPLTPPPLPRAHISARFVYECTRGIFAKPLRPENEVGEFLDLLLGVLEARPEYIHPADLPRYATLIRHFRASVHRDWSEPTPVASLPLGRLGFALSEWVNSVLRESDDPLMPSFCLDAARFIEAHAHGREFSSQREQWGLVPMVSGVERSWTSDLHRDQQLKRGITSAVKGLIVRCAIPTGCRIFDKRGKVVVAESGEGYIEIVRCHLSQGFGVEYSEHLMVQEDAPGRHDIADEFRFLANYWPPASIGELRRGEACPYRYEADLHQVEIPARWMSAWLDFSSVRESGSVPLWESVPAWGEEALSPKEE